MTEQTPRRAREHKFVSGVRARVDSMKKKAAETFAKYEDLPVVATLVQIYRRDQESANAVAGSAMAFRLFLFFMPLLLVFVGLAGFVSGFTSARDVSSSAGVSGTLAKQVQTAFAQSDGTALLAFSLGLVGIVAAGRSLSKVFVSASARAWQLPMVTKAPFRVVGTIAGLVCGIGLVSAIVNRLQQSYGLAAAGVSLLPAFTGYLVAWLLISMLLPRATRDPGALLPGAALVALTITSMHAISQFYLPQHLSRASELYGAIGTTIVTLGWFFFFGRAIAFAMVLNAVIYERFGSISTFVFSLPLLRILRRRSARLRRFFDLDHTA